MIAWVKLPCVIYIYHGVKKLSDVKDSVGPMTPLSQWHRWVKNVVSNSKNFFFFNLKRQFHKNLTLYTNSNSTVPKIQGLKHFYVQVLKLFLGDFIFCVESYGLSKTQSVPPWSFFLTPRNHRCFLSWPLAAFKEIIR